MSAPRRQNFSSFLSGHESGRTHADLTEELNRLTSSLYDISAKYHQRTKGKLSLTIDFDYRGSHLETMATIKCTLPQAPREPSIWYITDDGFLVDQDPNQATIFDSIDGGALIGKEMEVQDA